MRDALVDAGVARQTGLSQSTEPRTWRTFGLKPHLGVDGSG
ncbi:hypothetical protein OOK40_25365 [Streptomyces sp. NBC_01481]|nr:hypothetical protein [Streptomyces sp. NBC_01481]